MTKSKARENEQRWDKSIEVYSRFKPPLFERNMAMMESDDIGAAQTRIGMQLTFGDVWGRPQLDWKTKSTVTISILLALGHKEELYNHIKIGMDNGLSAREIEEIIIQSMPYCSFINASFGLRALLKVLKEQKVQQNDDSAG